MPRILSFIQAHKFISFIILAAIVIGSYFVLQRFNSKQDGVNYITQAATKGMLISSVSGTGQVSASNQVDVKAKTSGDIVSVSVVTGQEISHGAGLAYIDATDALKAVRDAETSLETAKLELEEILEPVNELTLLQAENSLIQAQESKETTEDNLTKSYEDGFNTVANAFLDLPDIMTGLYNILFGHDFSGNQANIDYYTGTIKSDDDYNSQVYYNDAYNKYQTARAAYEENFTYYKSTSRFSETTVIEDLIIETHETSKDIAEAIKGASNLIHFYQDILINRGLSPHTLSDTHLTNLSSYTSKTNSYLTSLLSAKSSIETYKDSLVSADRSIKEKELSLAETKAGADELTIRAKEITVQQKEDALASAQADLADCAVRAPFAGQVAEVNVSQGDNVSSGTTIATMITEQKIVTITLNEIDAVQVEVGQKASLTFDAVSDLSLTGEVVEVDTLGTVTQGVVSYDVKIAFDVQDERIKSGMSSSVNIITESKADVLLVPINAIKTQGTTSYVEILVDDQLQRKTVVIGSSNDTMIEITSGLEEGNEVITQTTSNNTTNTSQTQDFRRDGPPMGGMMMIR